MATRAHPAHPWFAASEHPGPVVEGRRERVGGRDFTLIVTRDRETSYRARVRAEDRDYQPGQREFDIYAGGVEDAVAGARRELERRAGDLEAPSGGMPRPVASVSAVEAAAILDVTPQHVAYLCKEGRLPATREGRDWRIPRAAVEAYRDAPKDKGGRPRKEAGGVTAEQLVELMRERGVVWVGDTVADFAKQLVPSILEGLNLVRWVVRQTDGATLFYRVADGAATDETRVLVVNAPPAERTRWEALAAEQPGPTIVVMAPGGRVA
jgi:excisionase family DNA binding protein